MISAVMITCDRSPGKNYVNETLQGIYERGTLDSRILERFVILETRPPETISGHVVVTTKSDFPVTYPSLTGSVLSDLSYSTHLVSLHSKVFTYASRRTLLPFEACAEGLRIGCCGCDWLLFMEDDIEISSDFFESVSLWLSRYGDLTKPYLYSFGNVFPPTNSPVSCGFLNPSGFFGTQCFAVRSIDALELSDFLIVAGKEGYRADGEYDLMIGDWLKGKDTHVKYSMPGFVQHIGKDSKINPRDNVHTFPSYPGKDWSYLKAVQ